MFRKIYAFKNIGEASLLISLLKSNKFHPLELQTSSHCGVAGADIFYYVQIHDKEYEAAKNFLIKEGYKDVL